MNHQLFRGVLSVVILFSIITGSNSQTSGIPDAFKQESIPAQFQYLQEHTRVYENFRAIREDIYRTISKNTLDTLSGAKNRINELIVQSRELQNRIDSLNKTLESTNENLYTATRTKESIRVLGMGVNKITYNSVMWSIVGILIILLVTGYFTFRQNRSTTVSTKKDLEDLQLEFEEYKKKTRLDKEKMTMDHFNEIKKLKAGLPGSRG